MSGLFPNRPDTPADDQLGFRFESPKPPPRRIWTVAELVGEVRNHIERVYADVWVEGEISNLRGASSGHCYFTLKDGESQLPIVLFRKQAQLLRFRPEDGLQVLVRGKVSVYEQRGQMQLVAEFVEPVGAGSLQMAFEQLKARLNKEGIFAAERKQALPAFPRTVGIITSPGGAVIRDFLSVVQRRHSALCVLIYGALTQGDAAAFEVAAGIAYFNKTDRVDTRVDVIVIARGGGSLEDLAPFNSELLARAIARSEIPIVSAVGHETDFTIADFVSDVRAPTASAAAEIITAAQHNVEERLDQLALRLERACRYTVMQARARLERLAVAASFARVHHGFGRRQQRIDELSFRMETAVRAGLSRCSERLNTSTNELLRQDATHRLNTLRLRIDAVSIRLLRAQTNYLAVRKARRQAIDGRLFSLSPLAVLNRGYALVYDDRGYLIKNAGEAGDGQVLTTRLAEGTLKSRVIREA